MPPEAKVNWNYQRRVRLVLSAGGLISASDFYTQAPWRCAMQYRRSLGADGRACRVEI